MKMKVQYSLSFLSAGLDKLPRTLTGSLADKCLTVFSNVVFSVAFMLKAEKEKRGRKEVDESSESDPKP